jgi:hypothetical protein
MNIKIPYKELGNISNAAYVAVILDKNNNPIYRRDYSRVSDPWFFSKTKTKLPIENKLYELCDSVVFYPYYNNIGWGNRIVIKKEKNELPDNSNKSLEYIKNSGKPVDLNSLKKWIFTGSKFPIKTNVIGDKNLIYFTAFGNNEYIALLKLLLKGLKNQPYRNFDILFITDASTKRTINKIADLKHFNVDFHVIKPITDPVRASMQKLKIHEYKKIKQYKKILFLDMDILVLGNLSKIFDEEIRPNKLYSGIQKFEMSMHNTAFHCINEYTSEYLDFFSKRGIFPFNAGQFMFLNTPTMIKHFKHIDKFAHKWKGPFFFEQSFLNTYFNVLCMSDVFKFKNEFGFISINMNDTGYKPNEDTVFVHFMGSIGKPDGKLKFIKKYYKSLIA